MGQSDASVARLVAPWRWRPVWQGLLVALFAVAVAVHGMVVSSRERTTQTTLAGLQEGLRLLSIERGVSIVAHDVLAELVMDMWEGGHEPGVAARLEALRRSVRQAGLALAEHPPSDGWRVVHEGMTEAVEGLLVGFDRPRTRHELSAWIDEFLYDFKRVVPTDQGGRWTALLEVATWAQESPLVFRGYLEVAIAREWGRTGRSPRDEALVDELESWLNSMRRLRESHGEGAAAFSWFEEYILPHRALEADSVAVEITGRLAAHPGVRQLEGDTPYLLSLTDDHAFESVEDLYDRRGAWVSEVVALAEELLAHARTELEGEFAASRVRDRIARSAAGAAVLAALIFAAVVIRRRIRIDAQLKSALQRDVLTGLANRYALFHAAPPILCDTERVGFAIIHLDLDDFKSINDEHGHHVGDRALIEFAAALTAAVRSTTDLVCRIGGDEFVIFLHELVDPEREVRAIVDRLKEELEQPIHLEGIPTRIHFTAGVAVSTEAVSLDDLLIEADLALIEAKEKGRDVAQFFRRKLSRRMVQELATALESGEVRCVFQPQFDLESGRMMGLEGLARWQREDRMQVPTRTLIESIEWLGAGQDWLRVAMRDIAAAWSVVHGRLEGRLWLNLMAADIEGTDSRELLDILGGTGVPLERLGVEITDPVGRAEIPSAISLLHDLRDAGVEVALDDVGDDRVPLLHVTELPVDVVKLDRCIVRNIDMQPPLRAVAQSLAEMCERIGVRVLAEGVETPAEEEVVREIGIRYVQGFFYSKPLPVSALARLFESPGARAAGSVA